MDWSIPIDCGLPRPADGALRRRLVAIYCGLVRADQVPEHWLLLLRFLLFNLIALGLLGGAVAGGWVGQLLAADGSSKSAPDLSKGTRFQLYLALRVAGYHEYAAAQTSVPFVADDILETFDDDRSTETFSLLADMARVGQVIYLTHHRHLCEIAQKVCPEITLHEIR